MAWYQRNRRDLPWRRTRDPWAILVSEVMLQQTQAARVVGVYERFMAVYPNPEDFARASAAEVVAAWEDLGYLRRARHLAAAARVIATCGWPADLTELPGVGRYTAAAVRAFAGGESVAAVDVNLRRVLSRWEGRVLPVPAAEVAASRQLDRGRPADWNQAMMDLGAGLCRPRAPRCDRCPVTDWCRDPNVELPSSRQSPFEGSVRQARAALLKRLATSDQPLAGLAEELDLDPVTVAKAVEDLMGEGAVTGDGRRLRLV